MIEISYKSYCLFGAVLNPKLTCIDDHGLMRYFYTGVGPMIVPQAAVPYG